MVRKLAMMAGCLALVTIGLVAAENAGQPSNKLAEVDNISSAPSSTQSQSAQDNCFACHNTVQVSSPNSTVPSLPGLNVNISHVLINAYFTAASKSKP